MRFSLKKRRRRRRRRRRQRQGRGKRKTDDCARKDDARREQGWGMKKGERGAAESRRRQRVREKEDEVSRMGDEGGRWKRWSCYPCGGAQVALTIHAHQRTYPSTTTHPPCLPLCFWMFEHWPSLVTPYPTHLREGHNGAPPKALNSKLSFRPA